MRRARQNIQNLQSLWSHRVGVDIVESLFIQLRLKLPGFINFLKFNLGMFSPSQCCAETFAFAEILTCSSYFCNISCCSLLYGRPFDKIYEIYHLKQKQIFPGFKILIFFWQTSYDQIFPSFLCEMVCVKFLWREIWRGTPLKFLSKMLLGETLCKCFPIFPPKVLVYIGQIFL